LQDDDEKKRQVWNREEEVVTTVDFERTRQEASRDWRAQISASDGGFAQKLCDENLTAAQNHVWKQNRRVRVSLALSLFADFEDPREIETRILESDGTPAKDSSGQELPKVKVAPSDERRLRVTLRPGVTYKVNEVITLDFLTYFKVAADVPRTVVVNGRPQRDMRTDMVLSTTWQFGKLFPNSKKTASMVFSYEYHKDPVPPTLIGVQGPLKAGQTFETLYGDVTSRRALKMTAKIDF
jgi:hypothetical protein